MVRKSQFAVAVALGVALFSATSANAATVTLSNIISTWSNGNPAANVTYANSGAAGGISSANWGVGAVQSGYDFNGVDTPPSVNFTVNPPPASLNEVIGVFTHRNQPIQAGTSITDIQLKITANVSVDGNAVPGGPLDFFFSFDHDETPNGANPCAYGGANNQGANINGCADRVKIGFSPQSDVFVIAGVEYTLEIMGFAVGGNFVNEFLTLEAANNSADLLARVVARTDVTTEVPLPAAAWLLLSGLAGLGVFGRRRSTVAS